MKEYDWGYWGDTGLYGGCVGMKLGLEKQGLFRSRFPRKSTSTMENQMERMWKFEVYRIYRHT